MKKILRILHGEAIDPPAVWLMRQAGRYLPEYRALRLRASNFLDFCYTPHLAIEASLQPIRRYSFDSAIIFSDILVIADALGQKVCFSDGEGPLLEPLRDMSDLSLLRTGNIGAHLGLVYEAVSGLREALSDDKAVIGFVGAPWTLAVYSIVGRSPRESKSELEFASLLDFCANHSAFMDRLIDIFVDSVVQHLENQIIAGAEIVQLFDSWAGALADYPRYYDSWVIRPHRRILSALRSRHADVPVICFPRGSGVAYADFCEGLLDLLSPGALSIDHHMSLVEACKLTAGTEVAIQGNLDPQLLLGSDFEACRQAIRECRQAMQNRAYIFNLGHGVDKRTDPDNVRQLVECLRQPL